MTTPANGSISLADVMNELRIATPSRAYPITLGDSDVRALAGVPSGAISLSNLYGKSVNIGGGGSGGGGGAGSPLAVVGESDTSTMTQNTTGSTYSGASLPRVTASGGTGNYAYQWSVTTGSGYTVLDSTTANPTVRHTISRFGFDGVCILACVVTDGVSSITVNNIQAVYSA